MTEDLETRRIIGAGMEVHRTLGHGFLEAVYQEALEIEFRSCGIPFEAQFALAIRYKGELLKTPYRADFTCYANVIVEIKALDALTSKGQSQFLNYLKVSGCKRGLLLNFEAPSLQFKRMVL